MAQIYRLKPIIIDSGGSNRLTGVNNIPFQIVPDMFEETTDNGVTWNNFSYFNYCSEDTSSTGCKVTFSGTGISTTITITPNSSTFIFRLNYNQFNNGNYQYIPGGTLISSTISPTNVAISGLKTILSSSINTVQGLCTSTVSIRPATSRNNGKDLFKGKNRIEFYCSEEESTQFWGKSSSILLILHSEMRESTSLSQW